MNSIRILNHCLTELLKYGDQYNVARCALLLGRLYLLELSEDRACHNCKSNIFNLNIYQCIFRSIGSGTFASLG